MKITDFPIINSKDNSRLKRVRAVRDGREQDAIFVEGVRLIAELIRSPLTPVEAFVSDDFILSNGEGLSDLLRKARLEIHVVASKIFDSIADTGNSQGVIVLADRPSRKDFPTKATKNGLYVYLIKINNPSNLGAVLRSAEAAGVNGVITSPGSTDPYSPKALRASMGSAFRLPIFTGVALSEAAEVAKSLDIRVVAADVSAHKSYFEQDWRGGKMLVMGSEAHGLDADEIGRCEETIKIPMENGVESLNLAVSAGIILFEAKRQRTE